MRAINTYIVGNGDHTLKMADTDILLMLTGKGFAFCITFIAKHMY